jgi:nitrate/nitrite-specific signal transduction histidine kinase
MRKQQGQESGYVRKVQEDTRRFVEDLLKENETLRTLIARVRSEKLELEEQVLIMRERLDRQRQERIRLQRQIAEIEADNKRFSYEFEEIEHQNSNLANLYVASYRLHGTLDRDEVLTTILEILINLVGSEEIAVFEMDSGGSALNLAASYGIDEESYRRVSLGTGILGRVAATGESHFDDENKDGETTGDEESVKACIALKVDGRVTGLITIFKLLPQKPGLEAVDHEMFELLATHAATAIYCTGLHAKQGVPTES